MMANINPILETSTENSPDLYDTIINAIESKIEKNDIWYTFLFLRPHAVGGAFNSNNEKVTNYPQHAWNRDSRVIVDHKIPT